MPIRRRDTLGTMSSHNLNIYYRITLRQVNELLDMIMSPEIEEIRYIWNQHDCVLTQHHFRSTVWLKDRRLAVVTFDMWAWPSIQEFLIWFTERIAQSGILASNIGQRWAWKANPHHLLCIC